MCINTRKVALLLILCPGLLGLWHCDALLGLEDDGVSPELPALLLLASSACRTVVENYSKTGISASLDSNHRCTPLHLPDGRLQITCTNLDSNFAIARIYPDTRAFAEEQHVFGRRNFTQMGNPGLTSSSWLNKRSLKAFKDSAGRIRQFSSSDGPPPGDRLQYFEGSVYNSWNEQGFPTSGTLSRWFPTMYNCDLNGCFFDGGRDETAMTSIEYHPDGGVVRYYNQSTPNGKDYYYWDPILMNEGPRGAITIHSTQVICG